MPTWWQPVVSHFISLVAPLFAIGPLTVSSFLRGRAHNAAVGGAPDSQHLLGTAVDLVPLDGDMAGLEAVARTIGFGYVLNEGSHVHVQLFPAGVVPRWVYDAVASP